MPFQANENLGRNTPGLGFGAATTESPQPPSPTAKKGLLKLGRTTLFTPGRPQESLAARRSSQTSNHAKRYQIKKCDVTFPQIKE